jgi:hypothetical protein
MALKTRPFIEAMPEELGEQRFILTQRNDAVANIAGRKHIEFLAESPARAPIVTDRDYGAEIPYDG